MSSIVKLSITGIRSFSPSEEQTIEFFTPLTVIVGPNGAGKTTLIECLLLATTGEFPPTTEKRAFVHDPKIASEREVRGKVMLRFVDVQGQEITTTRVMSVSMAASGKATFKTLDNTMFRRNRNGRDVSISQRCADINAEMASRLGVSLAILNNVIFCHQEDSLWPLSEPSELKKRFDDIFSATRYIKALEELKKLRKAQADEAKNERRILEEKEDKRKTAESLRAQLGATQAEITEATARIDELNNVIRDKEVELRDISKTVSDYDVREKEVDAMRSRISFLKEESESLHKNLTHVYTESDEELREIMTKYLLQVRDQQTNVTKIESDLRRVNNEVDAITAGIDTNAREHLHMETVRTDIEQYKTELRALAERIDAAHGMNAVRLSQAGQYGELLTLVNNSAEVAAKELATIREGARAARDAITTQLSELETEFARLRERQSSDQQRHASEQQQLTVVDRELAALSTTSSQAARSTKQIDELKKEISQSNGKLASVRAKLESGGYDGEQEKADANMRALKTRIDDLKAKMAGAAKETQAREALQQRRRLLEEREVILENLLRDHHDSLSAFLGREPVASSLVVDSVDILNALERERSHHSQRVTDARVELSTTDERIANLTSDLETRLARKAGIEAAIRGHPDLGDVDDDSDINNLMTKLRNDHEKSLDAVSLYRVLRNLYGKFHTIAGERHSCDVCERSFDTSDPQSLDAFMSSLTRVVTNAQAKMDDEIRKEQVLRTQLAAMQDFLPQWNELQTIQAEIAARENDISMLRNRRAGIEETLGQRKDLLATVTTRLNTARELNPVVIQINTLYLDLKKTENDITVAEQKLPASSTDRIAAQLDQATNELNALRTRTEARRAEQQTLMSERSELQDRLHTVQSELQSLEESGRRRTELTARREELVKRVASAATAANANVDRLKQLPTEIEVIKGKMANASNTADAAEKKAVDAKDAKATAAAELKRLVTHLNSMVGQNAEQQLAELERQATQLSSQREVLRKQAAVLSETIREASDGASKTQYLQSTVDANLHYRSKLREISELENTYATREANLRSTNIAQLRQRRSNMDREIQRTRQDLAQLQGRHAQLRVNHEQHSSNLRPYLNIEEEYRKQTIKVETCDLAAGDLERYMKAVNDAIMQFHALKMRDINTIIHELWTATYQGMDIDRIAISAEDEAKDGTRSYRYRVVMYKGQTALDMRGRCSAGQKVLVSIIVRLALAETFGINCGILALDEPTTNLDHGNIARLAEALQQIIHTRRTQKNFQLIVITHDENFVDLLGRSENATHYWRVSKNLAQHSTLEKRAFAD